MKLPKVISIRIAKAPRFGVAVYGVVQSRSRGTRVNHLVVKRGHTWVCSCEHHIFREIFCDHLKAFRIKYNALRLKLAQRSAA